MLRGEKIGLISDIDCVNIPSDVVRADSGKYGICISRDMSAKPFGITLNMAPKNIVLGIGSRKGAEFSALTSLVRQNLTEMQLARVCEVATIDRKANEPCILRLCQELKVPLKIYTAEQLAEVKGSFSMSEFVQSTVGVDNVCERSASVGGNTLIIRKQAGCGTGSVSVEMALQCYKGTVYSIDLNPEAIELTKQNALKFRCDNIDISLGSAPEITEHFLTPDKIFIGGSKGNLQDIISTAIRRNPKVIILITAVSLETIYEAMNGLSEHDFNVAITQASITRTKQIAGHTMLSAQNPVFIIRGDPKCKD